MLALLASRWKHSHRHVSKTPSSAHSLIGWRTSCRMLTNRAIVATRRACVGWERGVREPLHHASTAALPLAGIHRFRFHAGAAVSGTSWNDLRRLP